MLSNVDPGFAPWSTLLSMGYTKLGQFEQAINHTESAIKLDPIYWPAFVAQAFNYLALCSGEGATLPKPGFARP